MSDVSGVPNLGIPGLSGFNGGGGVNSGGYFAPPGAGLDAAYAQQAANQRFFGQQAAAQQAAHVPQSQLYGGGSFGAQPAYFAGVGAAYGRAVPQSSPAAVAAAHGAPPPAPAQVSVDSSPFDTGNAGAVPYMSGGGLPFGGGGFGRGGGGVFSSGAPPIGGGSVGVWPGGGVGSFLPTGGYQNPFNMPSGGGRNVSQAFSDVGHTPQMQNQPAIDAVNQFHGVGTGVPAFNVPRATGNAPIMNYGEDDSPPSIQPGSNIGGANPFTSGASPFPFAGGYHGSMRDRIASAITGPSNAIGTPQINGGPFGTGSPPPPPMQTQQPSQPSPTPSQMSSAWGRIGAGPGSPGVSSIAQQVPPPQSAYAPINQAIYDIGNVSRPGMFNNLAQPLGSMFSPGTYRGR